MPIKEFPSVRPAQAGAPPSKDLRQNKRIGGLGIGLHGVLA
jgi:hypothetical protein